MFRVGFLKHVIMMLIDFPASILIFAEKISDHHHAEWNIVKMNRRGKYESEILHYLFFLPHC